MMRLPSVLLLAALAAGAVMPDTLVRDGRYADAVRGWDAQLRSMPADDPKRPDLENRRALYAAIADVPAQGMRVDGPPTMQLTRNPLGTWSCAVTSGSHRAEWIFDTGANFSTVTASEARAMGLELRETSAFVRGSTGARNRMRLAIARDLQMGPVHLTNVVFLVLDDEALFIAPLTYQIHGIIGMPVLKALGAFAVSADGRLSIAKPRSAGPSNLTWDGWAAIAQVDHDGRRLKMLVDSGANVSSFYPPARRAFTEAALAAATARQEQTGGAGGVVSRTTDRLPSVTLGIGGQAVRLRDIAILPEAPEDEAQDAGRDGVLGMDALRDGFGIDFAAMRLTITGAPGRPRSRR